MIGIIVRKVAPKVALVAAGVAAGWQLYATLQAEPRPLDEPRRQAAEEACWKAAEGLPDVGESGRLAVLRLEGDRTGYVTETLRAIIERTGKWQMPPRPLLDRVKEELKIDEEPVGTLSEAVQAGRRLEVPYVLFGRVSDFTSDRSSGRIRMELELASVEEETLIGDPVVSQVTGTEADGAAENTALGWYAALPLWAAITALLPLATMFLIQNTLEQESNGLTFIVLVAYSLASGLLAFALGGFTMGGWLWTLVIVGAFAAALAYNYWIFCMVEENRRSSTGLL